MSSTSVTTQQSAGATTAVMVRIGTSLLLVAALATCDAATFSRTGLAANLLGNPGRPRPSASLADAPAWSRIPRGGGNIGDSATVTSTSITTLITESLQGLIQFMEGSKSDTLLLLLTSALNTPLSNLIGVSPIIGFLALGLAAGPKGFSVIKDVHTTEMIADLGIVLFLFEMGIHLSFDTLMEMKKDVFGLGGSQFGVTALAIAAIAKFFGQSMAASAILGLSISLSSSAFVLQLLKDKGEMDSQFGKKTFGILLLQDLMIVPLLVVTPLLAGDGGNVGAAVAKATIQGALALTTIALAGRFVLDPFFDAVAKTKDQNSFVGAILATILGMSFLTEGLGLSNTLGAFLAGMLLCETSHSDQIQTEIAPFRGILVGLFFFTVGFEIDLKVIASKPTLIIGTVLGIVAIKASIAIGLCMASGLDKATSQRVGLIISQGGEFAFVAFRLARSLGILDEDVTRLMLTCVSLTMAITPLLEDLGSRMAIAIEEEGTKKVR